MEKLLKMTKFIAGTILSIGIIVFLLGLSGYESNLFMALGIGTIMGAVFIFIIGLFLTVTDEMLNKTKKLI